MSAVAIIFVCVVGDLAALVGGFLIWAYWPTRPFEPAIYNPDPPEHWPTGAWSRSSPESQGMSSSKLVELAGTADARAGSDPEFFIDSMTVIRNGTIVAEIYPNPHYPPDALHVIHSATKSIVSALIGIAIDRGLIESVDTRLVEVFPEREISGLEDGKRALRLRDLLTMQSGLHSRDSYLYRHEGLLALQKSDDWVQFALDLPMAAEPGTRFDYSNIATFLLGAVLAKVTDSDVLSFARETLFEPLGIQDVRWEWTGGTVPIAWARMWLKPNDLAKIGLLYLQKGKWDGQQIMPATWIETSLTPRAFPKNAVNILNADKTRNRELSTRNWVGQQFFRAFNDGYGYQWWLDRSGAFAAFGINGQFLIVSPEHNLIFVATAKCKGLAQFGPAKLFHEYVLPAVKSDDSLPENKDAHAALTALAVPPGPEVSVQDALPLPDVARTISGKVFSMESNPYNTNNIRFVFDTQEPTAEISYTAREDWTVRYLIGLDGVYRKSENETGTYIAVGAWTAPDTLKLEVEIVGYTTFDKWEFAFKGDVLIVTESAVTGDYTYKGKLAAP